MSQTSPVPPPPPDPGVLEVVRGWFASASSTWLGLEPGVLADAPDAVHQMRVTSRRLRGLLRVWKPVLASPVGPVADELRWVAHALGEVRDLEVLEQRLLSEVQGPASEVVREAVDADRARASVQLRDDLAGERFSRLRASVRELPGVPVTGRWRSRGASDLVDLLVRQERRALAAWDAVGWVPGRPLGEDQLAEAHHARRLAKAARYVGEALADQAPELGTAPRAAAYKRVSDGLGEVQDAVVAEHYAWALASRCRDPLARAELDAASRVEAGRRPAALEAAAEAWQEARTLTEDDGAARASGHGRGLAPGQSAGQAPR